MRLQNGQLWPTHIEPRMPSPLIFERIRGTAEALSMIDLSAEQQLESLGTAQQNRGTGPRLEYTQSLLFRFVLMRGGGGV